MTYIPPVPDRIDAGNSSIVTLAGGATGDIISVVISGISGAASTTASLTWSEER